MMNLFDKPRTRKKVPPRMENSLRSNPLGKSIVIRVVMGQLSVDQEVDR